MLTEEDYKDFMDTFVDVFEEEEDFDMDELGDDYLSEGEDEGEFEANSYDEDDDFDDDDFDDDEDEEDDDEEED